MNKIKEGLKLKREKKTATVIPDVGRDDLPEFFKAMGYKVGAEIGTFLGAYAEIFGKSGLKLFAIDPWLAYEDYPYYDTPQKQSRTDKQYAEAVKRLAPYKNVTIIRKTSMDAAKDFANNSLDFVYIDGNHSFMYVAEDICTWVKKVRPGGVIAGHDYMYARPKNFHVRYVVDTYCEALGIKHYVLGRKVVLKEGEVRDRWRSWFFIKK